METLRLRKKEFAAMQFVENICWAFAMCFALLFCFWTPNAKNMIGFMIPPLVFGSIISRELRRARVGLVDAELRLLLTVEYLQNTKTELLTEQPAMQ